MTPRSCARRWEAEAAHDGRLSDGAKAAFEQHLTHCQECNREQRYVQSLSGALSQLDDAADEVSLRRSRRIVLERANATSQTPGLARMRARDLRRVWAGLAAFAAIATAIAIVQRVRPKPAPVTVVAKAETRWNRHRENDVEHVELTEGAFELVVHRRSGDPRVVVRVPEGEIEDVGTAFAVVVHRGRTERIAVREGSVVFRRPGLADARIVAGQDWSPPEPERDARKELAVLPAPPVEPLLSAEAGPRLMTERSPIPRPRIRARKAAGAASYAVPRAVESSVEDVAYLQIISLLRGGREEEARSAASAYLQTFPYGFRRPEVERAAAQAPPHKE
jgi:hypothetical protein